MAQCGRVAFNRTNLRLNQAKDSSPSIPHRNSIYVLGILAENFPKMGKSSTVLSLGTRENGLRNEDSPNSFVLAVSLVMNQADSCLFDWTGVRSVPTTQIIHLSIAEIIEVLHRSYCPSSFGSHKRTAPSSLFC